VLKCAVTVEELAGQHQRLASARSVPATRMPTEVQIDNETSDRFTIIDVFADDRQGLLYVITRTIFELGLSVHGARISTRLDQVADVFYVSEADGKKIQDHGRLEAVRAALHDGIESFLKDSSKRGEALAVRG
jgi:[protein-PII] uridylyltransferase